MDRHVFDRDENPKPGELRPQAGLFESMAPSTPDQTHNTDPRPLFAAHIETPEDRALSAHHLSVQGRLEPGGEIELRSGVTPATTVDTLADAGIASVTATAAQPDHLVIIPTFDSSVTSSPDAAGYESAVDTAINFLETQITTPITITIGFGYGENAGTTLPPASGATSETSLYEYSYSDIHNALEATDTTSVVQRAAAASLPATDPTNGAGIFVVSVAESLALGLTQYADPGTPVGTVGLSVDTYNWSQSGTQNPQGSDAVGELEHEITEVMGRIDEGGDNSVYTPLDLFRYTAADGKSGDAIGAAAGARDEPFVTGYSDSAYSYFSYNGTTIGLEYDTPNEVSGGQDIADWTTSTTPQLTDSFDGAGGPGQIHAVSLTDIQEMNALGYSESGAPLCFLAGTCIATDQGEVPVQGLLEGDLVRTFDGRLLPVIFVGEQRILSRPSAGSGSTDRFATGPAIWPVRVAPHAFGPGMPHRNLFLSPEHSVFIDGVLIPIKHLLNGESIVQEARDEVHYWHVEVARHEVLIAEGLPCESYLDLDGKSEFTGERDTGLDLKLEKSDDYNYLMWETFGYAPLRVAGSDVEQVRMRLRERFGALG